MKYEGIIPDEVIQAGQSFKRMPKAPIILIIIAIVAIKLFSTSMYSIEPNEVGVIRQFGKFNRVSGPGLHFKVPFGVEELNRVKVDYIFKEEFGFRSASHDGPRTEYAQNNNDAEAHMLTGDLNVLDVEWIVQYRVKDPVKFIFNVHDQVRTLRDVSQSVMREIIGDYSFNEALTEKRNEINDRFQGQLQGILDTYESGVEIVTVKLQDVNPPAQVQSAFNEVNAAKQEMEKMVNQAWQVYNQKIPAAKGESLKIVSQSQGYAQETVNRAKGEAGRFTEQAKAYRAAPQVTRKRIYLERMSSILSRAGKTYVVDPDVKGIVPLLNMNGGTNEK